MGNFYDELSSNGKGEVASMMEEVPKLSTYITHYDSHCLRANVQFPTIEKNMQSMKTDPYVVYMCTYQNKEVIHMRYSEGQVYYFGNKGMSLLGMMELMWKVDGKTSGFEY